MSSRHSSNIDSASVPHSGSLGSGSGSELPVLLFSEHIMSLTGRKRDSALRAMKRGEFGPVTKITGRYAVLRDSMLEALRKRAVEPSVQPEARRPSAERSKHYAARLGRSRERRK